MSAGQSAPERRHIWAQQGTRWEDPRLSQGNVPTPGWGHLHWDLAGRAGRRQHHCRCQTGLQKGGNDLQAVIPVFKISPKLKNFNSL